MPAVAKQTCPAQGDGADFGAQVAGIIDKKVRNLEKRRSKLLTLRDEKDAGKQLEREQLDALAKMDLVDQLLESAKDLQKQVHKVTDEHAKVQRRQQRAERQARRDGDMELVMKVMRIQSVLDGIGPESRNDFLEGANGALQLSADQLELLDNVYSIIKPTRDGGNFATALTDASEHLLLLTERSPKEVLNTTYEKLAVLIDQIDACGYLDRVQEETQDREGDGEECTVGTVEVGGDEVADEQVGEDSEQPAMPSMPDSSVPLIAPMEGLMTSGAVSASEPMIDFMHESTVLPRSSQAAGQVPEPLSTVGQPQEDAVAGDMLPSGDGDDIGMGSEAAAREQKGDSFRQQKSRSSKGRGGFGRGRGRRGGGYNGEGRGFNYGGGDGNRDRGNRGGDFSGRDNRDRDQNGYRGRGGGRSRGRSQGSGRTRRAQPASA